MNHALKLSLVASRAPSLILSGAISFFHSSPVLERKRRTHCNYRFNIYAKRARRMESKRTLLRDISEYAEYLFQSWRDDDSTPWFRQQYWSKGVKLNGFNSHESQGGRCKSKRKDGFDFCTSDGDDEDDVDTIFQSAFGGGKYCYWSSSKSGNFQWQRSSGRNHKSSYWRCQADEETDEDTGANACSQLDLASERLALGLSASGPLNLEEIKSAYRACALRWHPDRHHSTSKAIAEEKFKHCSAAYKSLCDRLPPS